MQLTTLMGWLRMFTRTKCLSKEAQWHAVSDLYPNGDRMKGGQVCWCPEDTFICLVRKLGGRDTCQGLSCCKAGCQIPWSYIGMRPEAGEEIREADGEEKWHQPCTAAASQSPGAGRLREGHAPQQFYRQQCCCASRSKLQSTCLPLLRMTVPAETQEFSIYFVKVIFLKVAKEPGGFKQWLFSYFCLG